MAKQGGTPERLAMEIVLAEEYAAGRFPKKLTKARERTEGCDFLSYPDPEMRGAADRVEVKGWGEPFFRSDGSFTYATEVNAQQHARAMLDPDWRLEIVANLTAVAQQSGAPERMTLTGAEVIARARTWKYTVPLEGLEGRIRAGVSVPTT